MKHYGRVRSTIKPKVMLVDDNSVWIHTDIVEIEEQDFSGFEYDMTQYDKNEYIRTIHSQIEALSEQQEFLEDCLIEVGQVIYA